MSTLSATEVVIETGKDDTSTLSTVTIEDIRSVGLRPETVEAGSFRGTNIMDVPSTVNVITKEALDLQAAMGTYDAVRNTAGVTKQQNGGETWDQLVIRGMEVQNRTNYRLNGSLPLMNFSQVPMEDKERIEVLKGASALYYGFTSPSGIINYVTKRPTDAPMATVGLMMDQYGSAVASADVSERFGEEKQLGIRMNSAGGSLGSYLDDVDNGNRSFVSMALDWRVNDRLTLKADVEYDRRKVTEQVGVALPKAVNGAITLPHTVDPKALVGADSSKFETETTNVLLRSDYALSDTWTLGLEAGRAKTERERNLSTFTFSNPQATTLTTGAGTVRINHQEYEYTSDLLRAELYGIFNTWDVQHDITVGTSYTEKNQEPLSNSNSSTLAQNLYTPHTITPTVFTKTAGVSYTTKDAGFYTTDRVTLSPEWQVIGGLRHSKYESNQDVARYEASETTPMIALVYKPVESLSLYVSYAEGLEEGEAAPAGTQNEAERLSPGISKQYELGAHWLMPNGTLASAAVFDIESPGYYTNATNYYVADGHKRYSGVELSLQGKLTEQLSWLASTQWLDPRFEDMGGDATNLNGKLPENAARRTSSLFLNYELSSIAGLSINGGAYYTGRRPVNDLNQAWLDDVTIFSVGGRYTTKLYGKRNIWQINVDNVADKEYWAAGGTRLASGSPRTIRLNYKVELY
jgi:iron complex outermembrane receptor protein